MMTGRRILVALAAVVTVMIMTTALEAQDNCDWCDDCEGGEGVLMIEHWSLGFQEVSNQAQLNTCIMTDENCPDFGCGPEEEQQQEAADLLAMIDREDWSGVQRVIDTRGDEVVEYVPHRRLFLIRAGGCEAIPVVALRQLTALQEVAFLEQ